MRTINIQASCMQRAILWSLHGLLGGVSYLYFQGIYFYLACTGIGVSGYMHWLHWPRTAINLELHTSHLCLAGETFYIGKRSHIGFFWLRIVLENKSQKTLWVFTDSTQAQDYRYLARLVHTGLMRDS